MLRAKLLDFRITSLRSEENTQNNCYKSLLSKFCHHTKKYYTTSDYCMLAISVDHTGKISLKVGPFPE